MTIHRTGKELLLCIRKARFNTIEGALNFLREDARSIVAPENRAALMAITIAPKKNAAVESCDFAMAA